MVNSDIPSVVRLLVDVPFAFMGCFFWVYVCTYLFRVITFRPNARLQNPLKFWKEKKWIILALSVLALSQHILLIVANLSNPPDRPVWSAQDRTRFYEIFNKVTRGDVSLLGNDLVKQEFQELYRKVEVSNTDLEEEKKKVLDRYYNMTYLFWRDALKSWDEGKLVISRERLDLEKKLEEHSMGVGEHSFAMNSYILENMANRNKVSISENTPPIGKKEIVQMLKDLESIERAIQWMYSPSPPQ